MPLSRHFYSLDEVQAALFYTASRYDAKEAMFWCKELIDSGLIGEAISTLFESWLWHKGPFCLSWLLDAWTTLHSEELSEEAILESVYQLCSCRKKDHSLWNILALTPCEVDRVTPKTPPLPIEDINDKEQYFLRAIYQGKARSAWWISQYMESFRVWELIEWFTTHVKQVNPMCLEAIKGYEHLLGYRSDEYDTIMRCCAILLTCLSPLQQKHSLLPLPSMNQIMKNTVEEWNTLNGKMARRVYSIPTACLYGRTQRGKMKWSQHNLIQLNCVEKYLIGCPFWEEAISEYGVTTDKEIQWKSDVARETFYGQYFPDDIPDEWTLIEKKKSHGDGVLGPNEMVSLSKYARSYLSSTSHYVWNATKMLHVQLEKRQILDCDPSNIAFPQPLHPLDESLLEPVHKRCIIKA